MRRVVIALITGSIPFHDLGDVSRHVDENRVKKRKKEKKWKVLPNLQKKNCLCSNMKNSSSFNFLLTNKNWHKILVGNNLHEVGIFISILFLFIFYANTFLNYGRPWLVMKLNKYFKTWHKYCNYMHKLW